MSRNLIAAKAWKNGRDRICPECAHFGVGTAETRGHAWDNCRKLVKGVAVDHFSKWDGDTCRYFEPRPQRKQ